MPWTGAEIPHQHARVAVVTGANSGLGFETARALAAAGAHVVLAVRNLDKGDAAREALLAETADASVEITGLDLASLASVDECAAAILVDHPRLHLLINNGGVMGIPEERTADGFERQLGTNHLGHFALTARLLPALIVAGDARVVSVTSTGRHIGRPVDPRNPHLEGRYGPWRAYGQSKLANLHFAVELHRRLAEAGSSVASLVAHPGLSLTELQATSVESTGGGPSQRFFHGLARTTGMPPQRAALALLRAATDPAARSGELYAPRYVNRGPPVRRPLKGRSVARAPARRLWEVSERETGVRFDVAAIVAQHRR